VIERPVSSPKTSPATILTPVPSLRGGRRWGSFAAIGAAVVAAAGVSYYLGTSRAHGPDAGAVAVPSAVVVTTTEAAAAPPPSAAPAPAPPASAQSEPALSAAGDARAADTPAPSSSAKAKRPTRGGAPAPASTTFRPTLL